MRFKVSNKENEKQGGQETIMSQEYSVFMQTHYSNV